MIPFKLNERVKVQRFNGAEMEEYEGVLAQVQCSQKAGRANMYHVTVKIYEKTDLKMPLGDLMKKSRANESPNKNAAGTQGNGIPNVQ